MGTILTFLLVCIIVGALWGFTSGAKAPPRRPCENCRRLLAPDWVACPWCSAHVTKPGAAA